MHSINTEIVIQAPIEMVWRCLTDFSAYPTWNSFMKNIQGTLNVGERLAVDIVQGDGKVMVFRPTLLTVIENQEFVWRGSFLAGFLFSGEHHFQLEKISAHQTRFMHFENFSGLLVGMFLKKFRASIEAGFLRMNQELKELAEKSAVCSEPPFRRWQCLMCDFMYDEAEGLPEEGIAPGTRWEDVPESWYCPDCGARKSEFVMVPCVR